MSYSCSISFKNIPAEDIFGFMLSLKEKATIAFEQIASDNYIFSPYSENNIKENDEKALEKAFWDTTDWAKTSIFTYRYFYIKELQLLGIYSIPNCLYDLFDTTIYFQNSCDRDYEITEWKGVKHFEEIAKKWEDAPEEKIIEHYEKNYGHFSKEISDLGYYRRTFAYDEIWNLLENTLYQEKDIVYLTLYGGYELQILSEFANLVKEKYYEWKHSIETRK